MQDDSYILLGELGKPEPPPIKPKMKKKFEEILNAPGQEEASKREGSTEARGSPNFKTPRLTVVTAQHTLSDISAVSPGVVSPTRSILGSPTLRSPRLRSRKPTQE